MAITGSTSVAVPAGATWSGLLHGKTVPDQIGFWFKPANNNANFNGRFGFNDLTGEYLTPLQSTHIVQGSTCVLVVSLVASDGVTLLDSGFQDVALDNLTGLPYLLGALRASGGGGNGFTQADRDLLSNVYGAVHHVFPPSNL